MNEKKKSSNTSTTADKNKHVRLTCRACQLQRTCGSLYLSIVVGGSTLYRLCHIAAEKKHGERRLGDASVGKDKNGGEDAWKKIKR